MTESMIAELEKAKKGRKGLDLKIRRLIQPYDFTYLSYTTSIDAALTLVPEGWSYMIEGGLSTQSPSAYLRPPSQPGFDQGIAGTPALALCIAALKARDHG